MTKFKFLLFFICIIPAGSFAQEHFYDFFKYGRNFGERNAAYYSNDNYMLLQGKHHTYGRELWVSDGTNQGTKLLKDCSTDPTAIFSDFASSGKLTSFNIYSKTDVQLWCTNGTTAGTKKLTESSYRYAGPTAFFKGWLFYLKVLNDDTFQIRRIDTTTFTMDSLVGNYAAPYDTRKSSFAVSDSFFYFNYDANLYRIDKSLGAPKLFWQKDPSLVRDIYSINIYKNVLVWCLNNSSGSETQIYSSTEKSGNVKLLTTVSDRCNILDLSGIGSVIFFTIGAYNSSIYFYKIETGTMSTSLVTSSVPFYMQHSDIEVFNNKLYFVARNANTFYSEIWSTNGTSAGTAMLKVIATDTMAIVSNLHAANGSLFFTAFTRKNGRELWSSKGTSASTAILKEIVAGTGSGIISNNTWFDSYNPSSIVFNNRIIINAYSDTCGVEPWTSDGTASGTYMLKDVNDDYRFGDQEVSNLMVAGNYLFLGAADSTNGAELWRTDGTRGGTYLAHNISIAYLPTGFEEFIEYKNKLFVTASSLIEGNELYTSNGTPGAANSFYITPSSIFNSSSPHDYAVKEPYLYYIGYDTLTNADNVFRTDGTRAGTTTLNKGLSNSYTQVSGLRKVGKHLFFSAQVPGKGREPMVSKGSLGDAVILKDLYSGTASSNPMYFCGNDSIAYFAATDQAGNFSVYKTNGTESGTSKLFDFSKKSLQNAKPDTMFYHQGLIYLRHWYNGSEFAKTSMVVAWDLAGDSLRILQPISGDTYNEPNRLQIMGNKIIFKANSSKSGIEPWITDGTRAGTFLLSDIYTGTQTSFASNFNIYNGRAFFAATNASAGRELWMSDGTPAGTRLLWDIQAGTGSSNPGSIAGYKGFVYLSASQGNRINSLFRVQADSCDAGALRLRTTSVMNTVCEKNKALLFAEAQVKPNSLNWYRNDSLLTNNLDTLKTGIAGEYYVTSNQNGCINQSNRFRLNIQPNPIVSIKYEKDSTFCEGSNIGLKQDNTDLITRWFVNNVYVNIGNTFKTTVAGSIYATGIDGFGCAKISSTLKTYKLPKPSPAVIFKNDSIFCTIAADSFQWFYNNVMIIGGNSKFYRPFLYGNYYVEAFTKEGCRGVSSNYTFKNAGVTQLQNQHLVLYPNPVRDVLMIDLTGVESVSVIDALGKVCLHKTGSLSQLNMSSLETGLYTVLIKTDKALISSRVLKE